MSIVSYAELDDLKKKDLNIEGVISDYSIDIDDYFDEASTYILRVLEHDWFRAYAAYRGLSFSKTDSAGNVVTNFDETKLLKNNAELINIHCCYTLHLIYRAIATQLTSTFETAKENRDYWLKVFNTEFNRLESVSDFYDIDGDGLTELKEQKIPSPGSQRFGNRYLR
jgi:hypothetical protein